MAFPLPLAFGFTNLALLGWLAAAAAPILIHLWMRHTHRDTPWAAIEFLREAIKRHARRLQLQQWILLALRTLVIVLLVLAAAKPYLTGWQPVGAGPTVHRLLMFDASMSMQYLSDGQTRFDRAKQLAREIVEDAPSGIVYTVALMADPPRSIVARPTVDEQQLLREIQQLGPTSGSAHLGPTLAHIEKLLEEVRQGHRDIARHEVLFFTDLGPHPWQMATTGEGGAPLDPLVGEQLRDLDELCDIALIDLGQSTDTNVAVSQFRVAGSLATTVEPVQVAAELSRYGESAADKVAVQLLVDGSPVDEQTVTLDGAQSTTITFNVPFDVPSWHELSLRSSGDALATDDQAWLAINVPQRVRILCIEGEPRAARYIARALNPSGEATSPLEPVVVAEGALGELPLEEFQCVFVCNVSRFTETEIAMLSRYVDRGGGLVVFLGESVLPEAYNRMLVSAARAPQPSTIRPVALEPLADGPSPEARSLLPARIGQVITGENFGIDPLDYQHPIVAAFKGRERSGLLTTPLSAYFRLVPLAEQGVQIGLATSSGDPLLVTRPYGKGMVALVATAASLDTVDTATGQPWTLLPAWPSFLPIVRELVAYTTSQSHSGHALSVGNPLTGELPTYWAQEVVQVVRPDGRTDTIPIERTGQRVVWNYLSTDVPGIYTARSPDDASPQALAAVNVDPRESDITRVDPATLSSHLSTRADVALQGGTVGGASELTSLHRWLLYAVLALLLVESTLAWWFGRGKA